MPIPVRFGKNRYVWSQNGVTLSPCLVSVLWLVKKVALGTLCYSLTASV